MTKRIAIAAFVAVVAACGSNDKCPTQSPSVSEMGADCVVRPGASVGVFGCGPIGLMIARWVR